MIKVALHQRLSGFCLAYEMREKRKGRGGQRAGRSGGSMWGSGPNGTKDVKG